MIVYRATLDVPRELMWFVAELLLAERRRRGAPRQPDADLLLAGGAGAALVARPDTPDALARDHGVSRATAYRYRNEVIEVLAAEAPDLHEALERARQMGCRTSFWTARSSGPTGVASRHSA